MMVAVGLREVVARLEAEEEEEEAVVVAADLRVEDLDRAGSGAAAVADPAACSGLRARVANTR